MINDGIIGTKDANPQAVDAMPSLCPRLTLSATTAVYNGAKDILNDKPHMQLTDPDAKTSMAQRSLLDHFDGQNVLEMRRIKISYDYEDNTIVDYDGINPLSGEAGHKVYEGEGGFYANFHYAVVPFDERYLALGRQELSENRAGGDLDMRPSR